MFKFILAVTLLLQLLLQMECLYNGDSCLPSGRNGTCSPIAKCQSIDDEIKRAGRPIPVRMWKKLQQLKCGFESRDFMVCCANLNRGRNVVQADDSTNTIGDGDNIEAISRVKSGPVPVEHHPNLHLLPLNCGNVESDRIAGGNLLPPAILSPSTLPQFISRHFVQACPNTPERNALDASGNKLACGGSLISEWYILTAAHCVAFLGNEQLNGVILGEHDVRKDPDCEMSNGKEYCAPKVKNMTIASVVAHPGYTPQSLVDDIALIRLAKPADFTQRTMKPLCLPLTSALQTESLVGLNGIVAGWGLNEEQLQSPVLLSVELPIYSLKDCWLAYKSSLPIKEKHLCAGGVKGKNACGADSGGPLTYPGSMGSRGLRYIQRGIHSFGTKRCALGGFPGIYTNVAYYMDWILNNMHS